MEIDQEGMGAEREGFLSEGKEESKEIGEKRHRERERERK